MWNFAYPYKLKQLIDLSSQRNMLFTFDGENYGPLLKTPRALVVYARGGIYGEDSVTDWLTQYPDSQYLPIGYFGASTGAAAALVAATERPDVVSAVVSRGGRPDLAGAALMHVRAPTLLIVGGDDVQVIQLNREALAQLRCEKQLVIVPGATHLFEEPGALDEVARLARVVPPPSYPGGVTRHVGQRITSTNVVHELEKSHTRSCVRSCSR